MNSPGAPDDREIIEFDDGMRLYRAEVEALLAGAVERLRDNPVPDTRESLLARMRAHGHDCSGGCHSA